MNMHCELVIAADHPSFAGHFPGVPILPGAVLLDEALHAIERARALDLRQWQIAAAKFIDRVRPGEALSLQHESPSIGLIRFTIRAAQRTVASGTLSANRGSNGSPHGA